MKIVLATPLYPPEIGGPATDAASLAEGLTHEGRDVAVCAFSRVRTLPKLVRHAAYFIQVWNASRGAGIIVAFDTVSVGVPAALVACMRRVPLVVRVPGDYAWEQGVQRFGVRDSIDAFQKKRYGMRVELLRSLQRFVVKCGALVIAPSNYFKGIVEGWGVAPARLRRIYLGIDLPARVMEPSVKPSEKVMFSVGRFVPWKGFSLLIELLPRLPDWQLVLAGDGPERATLEARAEALHLQERVHFIGALPRAEVLGWCRAADAFVLNTSFESFSFQILEAMAVGAAIVTTTAGSIPELITSGVEGVLCAPNDAEAFRTALESLTQEPEWHIRREAAVHKAALFSKQASLAAFLDSLHQI